MAPRNYFSYLLNPLELLRTKKVLHVNPTVASSRIEPEQIKIAVHDYNAANHDFGELKSVKECFPYIDSPGSMWTA
jgi:magnesium transporter